MRILIKNGRVIDPETGHDGICDMLTEDGRILRLGDSADECCKVIPSKVIDASGCLVMPGLIDMHVHLRDPGFTSKETLQSGAAAAARGGFTTICAMPNTKPVMDSADKVREFVLRAKKQQIRVLTAAAVTIGQEGKECTDIAELKAAGAVALSEDGKSVMDSGLYAEAMEKAATWEIPILAHCEDINLVRGGVINEGLTAERLGLRGISNAVEDIIAARDIMLAEETGARLHLCHCSTARVAEFLEFARRRGVRVSAEACPHHFVLCDEDILQNDSNYKMNPPLRSRKDMEAIRRAVCDGTINVISTDHAPHTLEEKSLPLDKAPFGIVGLETAVPLVITELVAKKLMTPLQMAERMSYMPARILGIDGGRLQEDERADIVIVDPQEEYFIDARKFASKGRNTPFHGRKVTGRVKYTISGGKVAYEAGK